MDWSSWQPRELATLDGWSVVSCPWRVKALARERSGRGTLVGRIADGPRMIFRCVPVLEQSRWPSGSAGHLPSGERSKPKALASSPAAATLGIFPPTGFNLSPAKVGSSVPGFVDQCSTLRSCAWPISSGKTDREVREFAIQTERALVTFGR
jgi:hypothetical protein